MKPWLPSIWSRASELEPLQLLHQEVDKLFNSAVGAWPSSRSGSDVQFTPRIDVVETDNGVRVCAELPGMTEKDVTLAVSGDMLTLRGQKSVEKEEGKENFYLKEVSYGSFSRTVRLPFEVDPSKAKAVFKNGVLTVTAEKPEGAEAQSQEIRIEAAS